MPDESKWPEEMAAEQGPRWPSRKAAWLDGFMHGDANGLPLQTIRERLEQPEFTHAVLNQLPPDVRPSSINLNFAIYQALKSAFPPSKEEESG